MSGDAMTYMLDLAGEEGDTTMAFTPYKDVLKKEWEDFSIRCPGRDVTVCNLSKKACKQRTCYYEYIKKNLRMFM